ncbi:amylo-alpha-1,6-glucosidase [Paraburkholderia rhizosphaerae]|uniref:Putative glycogen debranching enzyme n=1 Tax=Paraburkholderia rhizosphaerae TaxID=480658 RepID=A0A4R8LE75_9BURK|nr:amylo-alpha-1,6-glucosidase [Paraburkholderia rhizosphaerae]TDY40420.1 putative glycogen debranching enzyme [Paraburkholderia rhizosphaerae]
MTDIARPFDAARLDAEWLEADGFGGFASGTAGTPRTRRYHALLLAATRPPAGRIVLVNGIEAWLDANGERYPLTTQCYMPDLNVPDITGHLLDFTTQPWPTWRFAPGAHGEVSAELFVVKQTAETVLRWRLRRDAKSAGRATGGQASNTTGRVTLHVRPLLSGRDYHALHHENHAFNFAANIDGGCVSWRPYGDLPAIYAASNGAYEHAPDWYRNFRYPRERERGLEFTEDLATPGVFTFDLCAGDAVLIFSAEGVPATHENTTTRPSDASTHAQQLENAERTRRASFASRLHRAADAYVVARERGRTIVAGFPWFTDWGRDTFISMRGLLLSCARYDEAEAILLEWSATLSEGMLPNRFPDYGDAPEYNSVDASLWFVVAVHDYLAVQHASAATRRRLQQAVDEILAGYTRGTRFAIGADDEDGLLRAGVPGVQLTWMDAKIGDWVVTPRIGKPVEVQALWINALRIASNWNPHWREAAKRATRAFVERFVDPASGALFDVVDVDHVRGTFDRSVRPNQIFAVGGLPFQVVDGVAARAVVAQVRVHLLTPLGLRTLAPSDPAYRGHYAGGPLERDGAYHQGTVWPWLLGPFVEAWMRVEQPDAQACAAAFERFVAPLDAHLDDAGLDHISEVADGDAPHHCAGAPFQAWSLGERLRIDAILAMRHMR